MGYELDGEGRSRLDGYFAEIGSAYQCGDSPTDTDYPQFAPVAGGLYLTPTCDTDSIMNYCNPAGAGATSLSAGDILGVRSSSAYSQADTLFKISAHASTSALGTTPDLPRDLPVLPIIPAGGRAQMNVAVSGAWGVTVGLTVTGLPSGVTVTG